MKKVIFLACILVLATIVGTALKIHAGTTVSGRGWLWSGNTEDVGKNMGAGWISFNSLSCDTDTNTFLDVSCGGNNTSTALVDYGVNIPETDGALSGYAWSAHYGYIDFGNNCTTGVASATQYQATNCIPPSGSAGAMRVGNSLTGWARIVGIANQTTNTTFDAGGNAGGWEGWISLSGVAQDSTLYAVEISKMDGTGLAPTYAWSNEIGWIDFSGASLLPPKTIVATITASPNQVTNNTTPVTVTANVTGGTATGLIKYELDCESDGSIEETDENITVENNTFDTKCYYSNTKMAKVKITRENVTDEPTATIVYGCLNYTCNAAYTCESSFTATCPATTDQATCAASCKRPADSNWREVAP